MLPLVAHIRRLKVKRTTRRRRTLALTGGREKQKRTPYPLKDKREITGYIRTPLGQRLGSASALRPD
jgi:hypothetical protein